MSDTFNPLDEIKRSFFFADDKTDPRVNPDLRKRIALAMMTRQQAFPKTIGEGLTAIGQALGDRRMEERLLANDAAGNQRTRDASRDVLGGPQAGGTPAPGVAPPPPVVSDTTTALPPPPAQQTAAASPLPPTDTGAMPPDPLPVPTGTMPSIAVPPSAGAGAIPTQPGATVRDALARALAQQRAAGGPQVGPTQAGGQPSAVEFSSQNRPAPQDTLNPAAGIRPAPPPARRATVAEEELSMEPLTPIQQRAIARARTEPWNDDLKAAMKTIYDQEEVGRSFRQSIRQKRYEELKKQEDPQYQATLAKTRAEIAAGRVIQMDGRLIRIGEDGKPVDITPPEQGAGTGERPSPGKMNEAQTKAYANYDRAAIGHADLKDKEDILAQGTADYIKGKLPFGGDKLQSEKYKLAANAAENYVNAYVRYFSGAEIPAKELEREARATLPQYGDPPTLRQQKAAQREGFLKTMRDVMGPKALRTVEYDMNQRKAQQPAASTGGYKEGDTASDASGNKIIFRNGHWGPM